MNGERLKFTDEEIKYANSVNIINYALSLGYPVKQVSSHSFKIDGYSGLYIHSEGHKPDWMIGTVVSYFCYSNIIISC